MMANASPSFGWNGNQIELVTSERNGSEPKVITVCSSRFQLPSAALVAERRHDCLRSQPRELG